MKKGAEIRQNFIDFFKERGHAHVPGSPLIPPDDPTVMFTIAGMMQFKPLWAGYVELPYTKAVTCQKCVRAGGKGSDLENVGKTLRHHTFFEMLGNFSFGDYFKREAILWAWEFVTKVVGLPKDRLFPTIFLTDDEACNIWMKETDCLYEPARLDEKENFWGPAGETGACGPCSELCFFMGSQEELEAAKKLTTEERAKEIVKNGDLYLEIWNMVFPQFDQQKDGSRPPLKNRGIDTGCGLERITTTYQFIQSEGRIRGPYETDYMFPIVTKIAELTGLKYERIVDQMAREKKPASQLSDCTESKIRLAVNAIADHVRALTFTIPEGVLPSNDGRGYVLRRILRRALRLAYLNGVDQPFMYKAVDTVIEMMGDQYPEIKKNVDHTKNVIRIEEERFLRTLAQGEKLLEDMIDKAKNSKSKKISGKDVFLLHATYGFPADLTAEIAADNSLEIDREEFNQEMKHHKEDARKSWKGGFNLTEEEEILDDVFEKNGPTVFKGYEQNEIESKILAIIKEGERVEEIKAGEEGAFVLDITPFYAESGGQIGDTGALSSGENQIGISDTKKTPSGLFVHAGKVKSGAFKAGDTVKAAVNVARRLDIARNHTATHLLQGALKRIIGEQISQQGSFVSDEGFRFDFTTIKPLTDEEIEKVEEMVNLQILHNHTVNVAELPREEALKQNVIAPFGEKYGNIVRVVRIGSFSAEFCGGTHLPCTSIISGFAISGESAVASGVRRIEGVTGEKAREYYAKRKHIVNSLSKLLTAKPEELYMRVEKLQAEIKTLKKSLTQSKQKSASDDTDSIISNAKEIKGVKFISNIYKDISPADLRNTADIIKNKAKSCIIVFGADSEGKAMLLTAVTEDLQKKVHAGNLIKEIVKEVGGGGGGRPDLAQAGGKDASKLPDAIKKAEEIVEGLI